MYISWYIFFSFFIVPLFDPLHYNTGKIRNVWFIPIILVLRNMWVTLYGLNNVCYMKECHYLLIALKHIKSYIEYTLFFLMESLYQHLMNVLSTIKAQGKYDFILKIYPSSFFNSFRPPEIKHLAFSSTSRDLCWHVSYDNHLWYCYPKYIHILVYY